MKRLLIFVLFFGGIAWAANNTATLGMLPDSGPTLPATCNPPQLYFLTAGTIGLNQCTALNTWTVVPLSGGSGNLPGGTGVVRVDSAVGSAAELNGDVTSAGLNAVTVKKINGVALSGLATGIYKNTTGTGVPSIAVGSDLPAAIPIANVGSAGLSGTSPVTINAAGAIGCATCGVTGSPLSQFAATTSAQFFGVISDETGGAGVVVGSASPALTGVPTAPTATQNNNSTQLATTAYADLAVANAIAGVNPAVAVLAASTASLTGTYSNGVSGIGATFTVTATGAFTLDGVSINAIGQRVLLKNQASGFQNGVYFATVVGTVAVSPVFTRALDYDAPSDINSTGAIPVQSGTANASTSWLLTSSVTTVGTDALTYTQFSINPTNIVTATAPGVGLCHFAGSTQSCTSSAVVGGDMTNGTVGATQLAAQYSKGSCTEAWGGSGSAFALTAGDDAVVNNVCYNDSGVTRTITAVKCRNDNAANTTTVNPTFGSAGTGTTILSGALTCGNSYAYSSTGTVSNSAWTTGTGIRPVQAGTLTGTSIAMIVEYTY